MRSLGQATGVVLGRKGHGPTHATHCANPLTKGYAVFIYITGILYFGGEFVILTKFDSHREGCGAKVFGEKIIDLLIGHANIILLPDSY
jgi:hypothetical protein